MAKKKGKNTGEKIRIKSVSTGIDGLDNVLKGGFPVGRPTLIRGASGTGKSTFSLLFIDHLLSNDTPAIYVTFDESPQSLLETLRLFGRKSKPTFLDFRPGDDMFSSATPPELGGMLVRIEHSINNTGAKTIVLDSFDALFEAFESHSVIRRELFRVFDWARNNNITLIATSSQSHDYQPGTELLDYATDCLIHLQQKLEDKIMTRMLRVVKCRGRSHGTNMYPYIIDDHGVSVMPITDTTLKASAPKTRITSGIDELDHMLGGGFWCGNTIMISGMSGTGKSMLAMSIAVENCKLGKKVLYYSFEESNEQLIRDVRSVGINLNPFIKSGNFILNSRRSVELGLEEHIIVIMKIIQEIQPDMVIFDPINALSDLGNKNAFKSLVLRLSNMLKNNKITTIFTELIYDYSKNVSTINVSSLVDTWIRLRRIEQNGELNRMINVHKSRGSAISNQVREFIITDKGLSVEDPYIGPGEMVFGSAKKLREVQEQKNNFTLKNEINRLNKHIQLKRELHDQQIALSKIQCEQAITELEEKISRLSIEQDESEYARKEAKRSRSK